MIGETQQWVEKDRRYVWHALAGYDPNSSPLTIAEAKGAWVTDIEGNRYLDAMSGLWCVNAGYGREELARAAYEQLKVMPYYPLTQSHLPAIELGEKLNELLGGEYTFFFSNSGSEANEVAFKVARQYHQQRGEPSRWKFISRYRAYHGNSMGALAATGQALRKYRYEPLSPGFVHVEPPDTYRGEYGGPDAGKRYAEKIERVIRWELPETVAGVIMEPIITGGGVLVPPEDYMGEVERICRENGVLLISDEVICGFGRTGEAFGFMNYGVEPDIVTMAKGITSGYLPLSATAVKRELFEEFKGEDYARFRHVNTFGGNPAACALALKNLRIMEEENLFKRPAALGERLLGELSALEDHPHVGEIRGKGLLIGIELVEDKASKRPAGGALVGQMISACRERGLIVGRNGDTVAGYSNVITLAPPLSITEEDLRFIARTLRECIGEL